MRPSKRCSPSRTLTHTRLALLGAAVLAWALSACSASNPDDAAAIPASLETIEEGANGAEGEHDETEDTTADVSSSWECSGVAVGSVDRALGVTVEYFNRSRASTRGGHTHSGCTLNPAKPTRSSDGELIWHISLEVFEGHWTAEDLPNIAAEVLPVAQSAVESLRTPQGVPVAIAMSSRKHVAGALCLTPDGTVIDISVINAQFYVIGGTSDYLALAEAIVADFGR